MFKILDVPHIATRIPHSPHIYRDTSQGKVSAESLLGDAVVGEV